MARSREILAAHPVNQKRMAAGKRPATQIWLWGQGQAPALPLFADVYGLRGAIVTAVDLVRGVGALLGWERIEVPGATGYLDTDYAAKGKYAVNVLKTFDLVCVHVEAPDEASHEGRVDAKVAALEEIDRHIVGPLLEALPAHGPFRILISPDHPTPLRTRAHAHGFVPFTMMGEGVPPGSHPGYDEVVAQAGSLSFARGCDLMPSFLAPAKS
jgi:2,3-bisphosphoglycerate-independent phosphoglycerate mutase